MGTESGKQGLESWDGRERERGEGERERESGVKG